MKPSITGRLGGIGRRKNAAEAACPSLAWSWRGHRTDAAIAACPSRRRMGMTLVELIVAFSIMLILTTMAVPLVRARIRRDRERELRIALSDIRHGIDKFKDAADRGQIAPTAITPDSQGYPLKLADLVDGVKGTGTNADVKLKFLRRIPKDPLTRSTDWGMRSMQDDPKTSGWGGQNVFDVFTKSSEKGADGQPYSEW